MEVYVKLVNPKEALEMRPLRIGGETVEELYEKIGGEFGLEAGRFSLLSYAGVKLMPWSRVENGDVVQVCPSVLGGKGGFGSLLRAFGKQITMSTNKDACRDLTGRRIKQVRRLGFKNWVFYNLPSTGVILKVNNEKKMREFLEKQAEMAKKKEEAKLEKRKRRRKKLEKIQETTTGRHMFVDPKYDEQKQKIAQELEEALDRGMTSKTRPDDEASNEAVAVAASPVVVPVEKPKEVVKKNDVDSKLIDWMGVGDIEVSSSSEEDEPVKSKNL